MTIVRTLTLAALAAFLLAFAPQTQAAPLDLGALSIGASGEFNNSETNGAIPGQTVYGYAVGTIPSNSYITFTYYFSPSIPMSGSLQSLGAFSETNGVYTYTYTSTSGGLNGLLTSVSGFPISFANVDPSLMPVQATADLSTGTTRVTNLAAAEASFSTYFFGLMEGYSLDKVRYAVSAVPLPAALPLFGLGLIGLAGYSRHKRAKALA